MSLTMDARVAKYEPTVRRVVWLTRCPPGWEDDACQEGRIAVWRALQSYDPTKGCKESTWVWNRVYYAVVNWLRREGRAYGRLSTGRTIPMVLLDALREAENSESTASLHNCIPAADDPIAQVLDRMELAELCHRLTPFQLRTLAAVAKGYRNCEIARMYGWWPGEVSRRRLAIRRKWREARQCA